MLYLAAILYAIVGGPGAGKTSIVEALKANKEIVVQESASDCIIERQADGVVAPWTEENFQLRVLNRHIERERAAMALAGEGRIFTDRSLLDGYIYKALRNELETQEFFTIQEILRQFDFSTHYRAIFYINPYNEEAFVVESNEVRHEDTEEALALANLTYNVHKQQCPLVIKVPGNRTPEERARYILQCVESLK